MLNENRFIQWKELFTWLTADSILSSFQEYLRQMDEWILHLQPFKVLNLPFSTWEFLKLTLISINFSNKTVKFLNLLDELHGFINFPKTLFLCLVVIVVYLWTFHFNCISTTEGAKCIHIKKKPYWNCSNIHW